MGRLVSRDIHTDTQKSIDVLSIFVDVQASLSANEPLHVPEHRCRWGWQLSQWFYSRLSGLSLAAPSLVNAPSVLSSQVSPSFDYYMSKLATLRARPWCSLCTLSVLLIPSVRTVSLTSVSLTSVRQCCLALGAICYLGNAEPAEVHANMALLETVVFTAGRREGGAGPAAPAAGTLLATAALQAWTLMVADVAHNALLKVANR